MKSSIMLCTAAIAAILTSPIVSVAQAQGPVAIVEETPGLLAQAATAPELARLTAFGEFPGAKMVAAEIRREANRLVYSFEFKSEGHQANEQVLIDAHTGQVMCVEYSVEQNHQGHYSIAGPAELRSLVESGYGTARKAVEACIEDCRVLNCRLRVERAREVYVFDVVGGNDHSLQHMLVDANTGALISSLQPR